MKRFWILFLVFLSVSCKTYYEPDIDNTRATSTRLTPEVGALTDRICPAQGDHNDWRTMSFFKDVIATIKVVVGDPYPPHNVKGFLVLQDVDGNELKRVAIVPGRRVYTISFPATAHQTYFFLVQATSGCSGYVIQLTTREKDPCAKCGPGTVCCPPTGACCGPGTKCMNGRCVPTNVCNPPCAPGQECRGGLCVWPCGKPCSTGYRCDVRLGRCIRIRAKHKIKRRHTPAPKPKCSAGQVYDPSTRTCKTLRASSTVSARVLRVIEGGGKIKVVVNKGYRNGIRKGQTANFGSYTLRVIDLSGTRATLLGSVSLAGKIRPGSTVVILVK